MTSIEVGNPHHIIIEDASLAISKWYKDVVMYLKSQQFLVEMSSKERIYLKMKTNQYVLVSGILF
jgi:hypothetical protein